MRNVVEELNGGEDAQGVLGRLLPLHEAEKYKDDRVSFDKAQQMRGVNLWGK